MLLKGRAYNGIRKSVSLAKITRPSLPGVVHRKRLFRLLDSTCSNHPIIWLSGPAGYGKTTLVASYLDHNRIASLWYKVDEGDADIATFFYYFGLAVKKVAPLLTPEHLRGIPAFTKRYFENLCGHLKCPSIIVFDNYHRVPAESRFHEVIAEGLSVVPEYINVIVISRESLPPQLVRLQVNNKIYFLGWDEIRFTLDETREIVRMKGLRKLTEEALQKIHSKTEGWVAGLVLMIEMARIKGFDYHFLDKLVPEGVFDYFASEIFDKLNRETQDFLLMTAFSPQIAAHSAEELTGNPHAYRILFELNKKNYFTYKYVHHTTVYQYHPLFREFLVARARNTFEPLRLTEVKQKAAALLEASGQIEDAIALLQETDDSQAMIRFILEHAPSLLAQGRNVTLEQWLNCLPKDLLGNNPWLLYWFGASRISFKPAESYDYFRRAFELFKSHKDASGIFLSWSGVVQSLVFSFNTFTPLDQWISILDELIMEYKSFPSAEIEGHVVSSMLFALVLRQPQHPDFKTWLERALLFLQSGINSNIKTQITTALLFHHSLLGNLTKVPLLIESLREIIKSSDTTPTATILLREREAFYSGLTAMFEENHKAVTDGLELASTTGVHTFDYPLLGWGAMGALSVGDTKTAKRFLNKLARCFDGGGVYEKTLYHSLATWEALLQGDLTGASLHADLASKLSAESGNPHTNGFLHLGKSLVLRELGEWKRAEEHLDFACGIASEIKSQLIEFACLLAKAQFAFDRGDETSGLELLQNAMSIGRKQELVNTFYWLPSAMTKLCIKALDAGIEVEYVQNLICTRNLTPDLPPLECENWPWTLKIFTFGRFGLLKDNKPLRFRGKIQKKPLSLLKALISFGGREVTEARLMDVLWPDVDGDLAHRSFATTLHRLRKLIGNEKVIQLREGRVTLDSHICWVDAWAFERIVGKVDMLWKEKMTEDEMTKIVQSAEKAIKMYTGPFLSGEPAPWILSPRERLRNKFLRTVERLGNYWEEVGELNKAISCYQRGLETDVLAEEFYQHLMSCHQLMGRRAEAIGVYDRCRKTLDAVLGIEPSPRTEEIYKSLRRGNR